MPERDPIITMPVEKDAGPPAKQITYPLAAISVEDVSPQIRLLTIQPMAPHEAVVIPMLKDAAEELGRRLLSPSVQIASALELPQ